MNILYLITTFEKGVGGHYFSLQSTVESLVPEVNPVVINIGRTESPVIDNFSCTRHQFIYKYYNFVSIQKRIEEVIHNEKIDKIHCFDDRAYLFVRNSRLKDIPVALTKCGGPNPRYFPRISNLILFSRENSNFFQAKAGYKNIHLVPNRTLPFEPADDKVLQLKKLLNLDNNSLIFLRIARISHFYYKSLRQSLNLIRHIKGAQLIIIGQVIEEEVYQKIKQQTDDRVHIVRDEYYYKNAKEIIPICDFYIGTGRGIMEATSLKKIVLSPVVDRAYPALITEKSFPSFFNTNFSERNVTNLSDSELLQEVRQAVNSPKKREELSAFAYKIYNKEFNVKTKKEWYLSFYRHLCDGTNNHFIDKCRHFLFFHYHYFTQA